jgi:4-hydroxybenzoyl-CoA thioesterase
MTYARHIPVEFNHCDPAGRVFYPRYFEMVNSVVENFFADIVGRSFAAMHLGADNGVPTVEIATTFPAASRLGEVLRFALTVTRIGGASLELAHEATCGGEVRMTARQVVVWIDAGRAGPWPEDMRAALVAYQEGQA